MSYNVFCSSSSEVTSSYFLICLLRGEDLGNKMNIKVIFSSLLIIVFMLQGLILLKNHSTCEQTLKIVIQVKSNYIIRFENFHILN